GHREGDPACGLRLSACFARTEKGGRAPITLSPLLDLRAGTTQSGRTVNIPLPKALFRTRRCLRGRGPAAYGAGQHVYLDASILCPAGSGTIVSYRAALPETQVVGSEDRDPILFGQVAPNGLGSPLGKLIVVRNTADIVGKTSYL